MGFALLRLQLGRRGIAEYERQTASSGSAATWASRLGAGLGPADAGQVRRAAEENSMAWIWDKVGKRRSLRDGEARQERFISPTGSFEILFAELARRITRREAGC